MSLFLKFIFLLKKLKTESYCRNFLKFIILLEKIIFNVLLKSPNEKY